MGRLARSYDRLVAYIPDNSHVLDLGCGTGLLTIRAARHGATVKGIDVNPEMLEIAQQQAQQAAVAEQIDFEDKGVAELDNENLESYDVVTSGLCFSELTKDELSYTLNQIQRILKLGGLLLVADEVRPVNLIGRYLHSLLKAPLATFTYLLTQQTTHAIVQLPEKIVEAGLSIKSVQYNRMGSFIEVVASKSGGKTR